MRRTPLCARLGRGESRALRLTGIATDPTAVRAASNPTGPSQLWLADLAIAPTEEGWLILAVVLDCYSRRCLGWWGWAADQLRPEPVFPAVEMAVAQRSSSTWAEDPDWQPRDVPLAVSWRCRRAGVTAHPGAEPSTMDAAVAESFFALLRTDLLEARSWLTRTEAYDAISGWIERYNDRGMRQSSENGQPAQEWDEINLRR